MLRAVQLISCRTAGVATTAMSSAMATGAAGSYTVAAVAAVRKNYSDSALLTDDSGILLLLEARNFCKRLYCYSYCYTTQLHTDLSATSRKLGNGDISKAGGRSLTIGGRSSETSDKAIWHEVRILRNHCGRGLRGQPRQETGRRLGPPFLRCE